MTHARRTTARADSHANPEVVATYKAGKENAIRLAKALSALEPFFPPDHALNARECDVVSVIRELTEGNGADIVFECAGGSPKQGMAGTKTITQAIDAVCSGGKIVGVSWFGGPLEMNIDLLRERSLRYVFPDISTQMHLEHTVRLVSSGRVHLKSTITHVLDGLESVPQAFEITANKGKFQAVNPAQVVIRE